MAEDFSFGGITVQERYVVEYGSGTWAPTTKMVGGNLFCRVAKWDRSFVKFCLHRPLQLSKKRPKVTINCDFYDHVFAARRAAMDKAVQTILESETTDRSSRPTKIRKVTTSDAHIAPEVLTIDLPPINHSDINIKIQILFGFKDLWIRCDPETLFYMRQGIAASVDNEKENAHGFAKSSRDAPEPGDGDGA
jgi:hypothetical protein